MIFDGLRAAQASRFGVELADFMLAQLAGLPHERDAKSARKVDRILAQAAQQVQVFKKAEPLNFYKKARLSNSFLWQLKDKGLAPDHADELTEWLSRQL
jgi:hypothetical protein